MPYKVFGDNLLVEIKKAQFTTSESDENPMNPNAGYGVVVGIPSPDEILYFGSYNWAFDQSMLDEIVARKLVDKMKKLEGKTVYWEARSDIGGVLEDTSEHKLCIIKLSKIITVEEN